MTVIASYNHFGCGIVIGDILINGPVDEERPPKTSLPTIGNVENFFGGAWGIHKSSQKVCIISDHCTIAWAGSKLYAHLFIDRIRNLARRITITKDIIERLLNKYGSNEISIVGAIYENGSMHTFGFDSEYLKCPILGDIYNAGSGASVIREFTDIVQSMKLDVPNEDEISARGVSLALTQVAHLLNAEFRKGDKAESILEFFGGGYEIAAFYDGKFQKINSNFVFHDISMVNGYLKMGNPRLLIGQTYSANHLCFQSISPRGMYDGEIMRNEVVEISPFATSAINCTTHPSSSILNWSCFVFVDDFRFLGEQLISLVLKSETPPIEYSVYDGKLEFSYSEKAGEQIEDFLIRIYENS
ncbi:hypothetical protein PS685_01410 [Pseudomonas fluorescens]|uniref:Uncharacterized protein n=1 Tax=Pseudomonas fluorescens TaxID=294 RepID=A0A5E6YL94_PSEFL|nr:hypothetical protein [Pseudomonas fluorescens]VVN53925.1 hypothetical protein PS685_01410 [Pseudomonas fluorescens]